MSDDYRSCGCHGWKSWFSLGRKLSWDRPDADVVDVVGPVGPRRGGEESCWGNIFVEILGFGIFWRQKACHGWNLIGGGAAGGAPVPQLGLPQPGAGPGPEWDWYWPWMPWNENYKKKQRVMMVMMMVMTITRGIGVPSKFRVLASITFPLYRSRLVCLRHRHQCCHRHHHHLVRTGDIHHQHHHHHHHHLLRRLHILRLVRTRRLRIRSPAHGLSGCNWWSYIKIKISNH